MWCLMVLKINEPRVKDYYYVSDNGEVYSNFSGEMLELKYRYDKDGYRDISLQIKDGRRIAFKIHRLVALTFIPNSNNFPVINHKDCNKENNNIDNLEWTTISYNTQHAYDNNLINHGRIRKVKMTNIITGDMIIFDAMKDVCDYFNYSVSSISKMCSGKLNPYKKGRLANIKFEYYDKAS